MQDAFLKVWERWDRVGVDGQPRGLPVPDGDEPVPQPAAAHGGGGPADDPASFRPTTQLATVEERDAIVRAMGCLTPAHAPPSSSSISSACPRSRPAGRWAPPGHGARAGGPRPRRAQREDGSERCLIFEPSWSGPAASAAAGGRPFERLRTPPRAEGPSRPCAAATVSLDRGGGAIAGAVRRLPAPTTRRRLPSTRRRGPSVDLTVPPNDTTSSTRTWYGPPSQADGSRGTEHYGTTSLVPGGRLGSHHRGPERGPHRPTYDLALPTGHGRPDVPLTDPSSS